MHTHTHGKVPKTITSKEEEVVCEDLIRRLGAQHFTHMNNSVWASQGQG